MISLLFLVLTLFVTFAINFAQHGDDRRQLSLFWKSKKSTDVSASSQATSAPANNTKQLSTVQNTNEKKGTLSSPIQKSSTVVDKAVREGVQLAGGTYATVIPKTGGISNKVPIC